MASNDYCIIIPNYNHTQHIENVLQQISQQQLPVILINFQVGAFFCIFPRSPRIIKTCGIDFPIFVE